MYFLYTLETLVKCRPDTKLITMSWQILASGSFLKTLCNFLETYAMNS